MKDLALRVLAVLLVAFLGSCAAGYGVANYGGAGVVGALRDVGIMILALFSLLMAVVWGAIYFGAAWAIARFGPKGPAGVRWVGGKVGKVEELAERGTERGVVRPLARLGRRLTAARTFVSRLLGGEPERREVRQGIAGWPTFWHRMSGVWRRRHGLPPPQTPPPAEVDTRGPLTLYR